uniref:Uncharacterized protein n=1 Tax=Pinguiococcus pyrenoidosus TaxID=172671 RepID=A0A7R9U7N8_9STRA
MHIVRLEQNPFEPYGRVLGKLLGYFRRGPVRPVARGNGRRKLQPAGEDPCGMPRGAPPPIDIETGTETLSTIASRGLCDEFAQEMKEMQRFSGEVSPLWLTEEKEREADLCARSLGQSHRLSSTRAARRTGSDLQRANAASSQVSSSARPHDDIETGTGTQGTSADNGLCEQFAQETKEEQGFPGQVSPLWTEKEQKTEGGAHIDARSSEEGPRLSSARMAGQVEGTHPRKPSPPCPKYGVYPGIHTSPLSINYFVRSPFRQRASENSMLSAAILKVIVIAGISLFAVSEEQDGDGTFDGTRTLQVTVSFAAIILSSFAGGSETLPLRCIPNLLGSDTIGREDQVADIVMQIVAVDPLGLQPRWATGAFFAAYVATVLFTLLGNYRNGKQTADGRESKVFLPRQASSQAMGFVVEGDNTFSFDPPSPGLGSWFTPPFLAYERSRIGAFGRLYARGPTSVYFGEGGEEQYSAVVQDSIKHFVSEPLFDNEEQYTVNLFTGHGADTLVGK